MGLWRLGALGLVAVEHLVEPTMETRCSFCTLDFTTEEDLMQHLKYCKRILKLKCEDCKETFKSNLCYSDHVNFECGKVINCPRCNTAFKLKRSLRYHMKYECGVLIRCQSCKKNFKYLRDYNRHITYECGKILQCQKCSQIFKFKNAFDTHVKHECGKVLQCPDCNSVFTLKKTLEKHIKFECGKAPRFACELCTYRAKRKDHLQKHMRVHHKYGHIVQ